MVEITGPTLALILEEALFGAIAFTVIATINYLYARHTKQPSKIVDDTSAENPITISSYTPRISGNVVSSELSPISIVTNAVLEFQPLPDIDIEANRGVLDSRIVRGSWGHVAGPRVEYVARFGVIRVRSITGSVLDCRVRARIKKTYMRSNPVSDAWQDYRCLNWFLEERREAFEGRYDHLDETKWAGLNTYLHNTSTDISEGHDGDLLVFYMIRGAEQVFLCNEGSTTVLDFLREHEFTRFLLELSVTGRGYAGNIMQYMVNVSWDRFSVEPINLHHA